MRFLLPGRFVVLGPSGVLLIPLNGYDAPWPRYLHAQVGVMNCSFEHIEDSSPEDNIILITHVNYAENDVFGSRVRKFAERDWQRNPSQGMDWLAPESHQGEVGGK